MDLVAFLLERLGEDEQTVISLKAPFWWQPEPLEPARVLTDIAAKRRIVKECDDELRSYPSNGLEVAIRVLRLLALPYAGHPDYREEWQP